MLTWWQGDENAGHGRGADYIYNTDYKQIDVVHAADGLPGSDLHEFLMRNNGAGSSRISRSATPARQPLMDSVVQEIDIKTGLVMFEWHSPRPHPARATPSSARRSIPATSVGPVRYPSTRSAIDRDGNPVVSARNTWADLQDQPYRAAALCGRSARARAASRSARGQRTAFQHDLVVQAPDGTG